MGKNEQKGSKGSVNTKGNWRETGRKHPPIDSEEFDRWVIELGNEFNEALAPHREKILRDLWAGEDK